MKRLLLMLACMLVWLASGVSSTGSPVFADDFNDNWTNPALWTISTAGTGPRLAETNQRLEITLPAESSGASFWAGYESVFRIRGDFDVQVDYALLEWPADNYTRVGFGFREFGAIERTWGTPPGLTELQEVYLYQSGQVPTAQMSGTMRMVRAGDLISTYYLDSGQWIPIYSSALNAGDATAVLSAWNHDASFGDQQVRVMFDDFTVNSGQIISPVPEPCSLLAVLGGVSGMGGVMRRRKK